jgi:hypothetical protein
LSRGHDRKTQVAPGAAVGLPIIPLLFAYLLGLHRVPAQVLRELRDFVTVDARIGISSGTWLTDEFGPTNHVCEYLANTKGHWMAVPISSGTQMKGPCGRISVLRDKAGIDVTACTRHQTLLISPSAPTIWNSGMNSSEPGTR